jgi:uncharacterized protein YbjT (DUF2867 family)
VARVLIVGCGCRGRLLAGELLARGHAVRGTSRDSDSALEIAASGVQPFIGDPSQVGTLTPALEGIAVVCLLLGSATGTPAELEALHGSRLEMLLQRIVDTTVRGLAYEAAGSGGQKLLGNGARIVREACELSRIPFVLLTSLPAEHEAWAARSAAGLEGLLER